MKKKTPYITKDFKDLKEMIENSGKEYADNVAFVIKHVEGKNKEYQDITYKQFVHEMNALGTELIQEGYKGKNIAVIGKNSYEWFLTYTAVINGVGVIVPLDKGLPQDEIEMSVKKAKIEVIVCEESYLEMINQILEKDDNNLNKIICMEEVPGYDNVKDLVEKGKELLNEGNREYVDAKIDADKMATIVFTSGTTALSKAVMLSHKNIVSNINAMVKVEKLYDTDTNIAFLPFHHTFGSTGMLVYLSRGMRNVFCDGLRHVQENLKEYKVTVFICVPLLIESMYKKIEAGIEKKGKTKLIKFAKALSKFLLKFGIDIRRKLFKEVLDELGGELRFIVSRSICT